MSTSAEPDFELLQDDKGRLVLVDAKGVRHENVFPAKLFPLTDSDRWISIQGEGGRELACIEDPKMLPEASRTSLMAALAGRDFVPVIRVIHRIIRAANGHEWQVTTDRGATSFAVETDESIQNLGNGRLVVIDRRNTRYLIPNVASLDRDSKRRLERYY